METITKDMLISEIIELGLELSEIFFGFGMFCISCQMASGETLEQACAVHGIDVDQMVDALNEALTDKEQA